MLEAIIAILAGLVLMTGILSMIPAVGNALEKFAQYLGGFQVIIGVIALILGILDIIGSITLLNVMLILSGLLLLTGVLPLIPGMGDYLEKFAKWLSPSQALIGAITIIAAILSLL